jgi:hypothetical protein
VVVPGERGVASLDKKQGAVEFHKTKLGNLQVTNKNSDVQLYIPDKAAFQLDAHARGGEIESDFDALSIENGDDKGSANGSIGAGGPHLVISNEHGGIELRRGSTVAEAPAPPNVPAVPKVPRTPAIPKVPVPTEN